MTLFSWKWINISILSLDSGVKYDPSNQHSHHDREDDGGHSGLEDPEDGQTCDLHHSEEVHAPQRYVTQEHEIWLVLGWHEEQLHPLPELNQTGKLWWNLPPRGHRVPKLKLSLITSTWLHLIISKIFIILHHSYCCYVFNKQCSTIPAYIIMY